VQNNPINWVDPDGLRGDFPIFLPIPSREEFGKGFPQWTPQELINILYEIDSDPTAGVGPPAGASIRLLGKGAGTICKIEKHHLLPKQFIDFFKRAGLNIEEYTMEISKQEHRQSPGGLHTGTENWNKIWADFFKETLAPTRDQILNQLGRIKKVFGL
jgi:hypothetical protein